MQCQLCDKQATVHLTEIVDGEKTEKHLCEDCAHNDGITIKAHVPINELLTDLVKSQEQARELSELTCPRCNMTWSDFRKGGLLGCPEDYEIFDAPLRKIILKTQENAKGHIGRSPLKTSGKYEFNIKKETIQNCNKRWIMRIMKQQRHCVIRLKNTDDVGVKIWIYQANIII